MLRPLFCALALVVSLGTVARAEEVKIGYVDFQRALGETEDGRKAKASLKKIFDQKQKELDEQQEALKKGMDDFQKKRTLLGEDVRRQKEQEFQEGMQKIQQSYMRHQQDLQGKEQEMMRPIVERMQRIMDKIASSENFTMVFDVSRTAVAYAKPHLDLTNELIRRYNAGEGAGAAAKPAAGAKPAPAAPKK